jgi:hypothetical protein
MDLTFDLDFIFGRDGLAKADLMRGNVELKTGSLTRPSSLSMTASRWYLDMIWWMQEASVAIDPIGPSTWFNASILIQSTLPTSMFSADDCFNDMASGGTPSLRSASSNSCAKRLASALFSELNDNSILNPFDGPAYSL